MFQLAGSSSNIGMITTRYTVYLVLVPVPQIYLYIPSLLTDFKISNFVTFSYSGSMKDNRPVERFFTSIQNKKKISFSALKKKSLVATSSSAHSSSWHLFLSQCRILESRIEPFSRKHHTCTDLIFPLSMGVLARNYEKIYFRENIYVFFAAFRQF